MPSDGMRVVVGFSPTMPQKTAGARVEPPVSDPMVAADMPSLIDTFNEYRARGYGAKDAAFRAGLVRFRPVLLTAVTTILGLMPMVFQLTIKITERDILVGAPSSQWWTQLSSTIAGGLAFATILTLVATPAMLVIGDRLGRFGGALSRRTGSLFRFRRTRGVAPAE